MSAATVSEVHSPNRLALPLILAAQLVIPLSIAGTAVSLPTIAHELGNSPAALQWVVNGFNVSFALMTIVWGRLSDRFGHDRVFRAGAGVFLIASLLSVAAPGLLILDLARILAGVGAAAVLTSATAILSLAWEGPARTRAFALFGTVNGLGLALGPVISGAIAQLLGWRAIFGFPAVVLLIVLAASRAVPRVRVEDRGSGPLLDLWLLRNRGFLAMVLVPVAGAIGFVTFLTYLPAAFSAVYGWSAGTAGTMMLIATLPVIVSPGLVGAAMRRTSLSAGGVVMAALACLVLGAVGMLLLLSPALSPLAVVPALLFIGFGFGLPLGLVDGEALAQVSAEVSGSAAGLLNFVRIGSEAAAVAVYSAALALVIGLRMDDADAADRVAAGGAGGAEVYAASLHSVSLAIAGVVVVLMVLIAVLRRRPRRRPRLARS